MRIDYHIEKLEYMYYDLFLSFKFADELDCKYQFALVDENINKFIKFTNNIRTNFIQNEENMFYLDILDDDHHIYFKYENGIIVVNDNYSRFEFKNITEILSTFMKIVEDLENN